MSSKYETGERIGGGGMADVFHGVIRGAEGFERKVAVKRIKRSISTDKGFAKLFIDEARLAAKLMHPNVVQTIDFDRDETGCFYLVMELIEGVDLRQLVSSGRVPVSAVVFVVTEVLRALDYAHEMVADGRPLTIVHRDISPHNIMLSWQGSVKVVDFGIAKAIEGSLVSRSGSLKGKVAYMSPEQVHGQALDGRSDLFALGVILHELLTGERLFIAKTEAATLSQVLTKPIPSPRALNDQVPADLDAVVMRLLHRDRDQRFERARDAIDALSACASATTRGRNDLETVLAERFPGQGPQRVRHLSTAPDPARASGGVSPTLMTPAHEPSGMADTLAATPRARTPAPGVPKRTVTAVPVRAAGASSSLPPQPAVAADVPTPPPMPSSQSKSRLPVIGVGLALLSLVALALALVFAGDRSKSALPPSVEVLAVGSDLSVASHDHASPAAPADASSIEVVDASVGASHDAALAGASARTDAQDSEQVKTVHKKAQLTIRVRPWAQVAVDGRDYGQTPQTIELDRGKHRIVLRNDGMDRVESFTITLRAGQAKRIEKDWTEN